MRRIKSSAKAALSVNRHVFTPWMRFHLGVHAGERWAWLVVGAAALLLTLLHLPQYAVAVLLLAAFWRMVWVILVPLLRPRLLSRVDGPNREAAFHLLKVHRLETGAWILLGAAFFVLALMHLPGVAIAVLAAAAACKALVAAVTLIFHRLPRGSHLE